MEEENKILEEINEQEEVKTENDETDNKISYIIFSSGNQYTFVKQNKAIYQGKVKIASFIKDCDFILENETTLKVNITFEGEELDIVRMNTFNMKK